MIAAVVEKVTGIPDTPALIERCKRGDQRAWNALVERFGRLVYSIPRHYGLDQSSSEDVLQEVFCTLFTKLGTISDPERISAWLITTTHRECWRLTRKRRRQCEFNDQRGDEREPAEELASKWEQQQLVREALNRLSPRERELMAALFLEPGSSDYESVAWRLGMKLGSIGPTRARCFKKLERILIELGIDAHLPAIDAAGAEMDAPRPRRGRKVA